MIAQARMLRTGSVVLLGLLWLLTAWRAATQSIVHDEALTWQFYLATPVSAIFEYYDANNHFLAVLLMRMVTGIAGYSELAMRLVSLAGGALHFYSSRALCLRVFGERWMALGALALLSLNPLLLDFLVAARGYGPAMALFMTGLWLTVEALEGKQPKWKRVALAGACLGGSFAANLIFVLPALTLTAAYWWVARGRGTWVKWLPLGVAAVGFLLFVFSPIAKAQGENFYAGTESVQQSVNGLARCSLAHNEGIGGLNADNAGQRAWRTLLAGVLTPLLVLAGLWAGRGRTSGAGLAAWLAALCLAVPAIVLVAGHAAVNMPLPGDRTGLYLMVLPGLLLAGVAASLLEKGGAWKLVGMALLAVGALVSVQYALQLQTRSFLVWRYDADTLNLLETAQGKVKAPARAAVSWQYEPTANFYRVTKGWQWLEPVTRESLQSGGDFYLLMPGQTAAAEQLKLKTVARGEVSGTLLCLP